MTVEERIAANERLVFWAVGKYLRLTSSSDGYDDAVQVALIALWKAAKAFDASRNLQFSTFAGRCMRNDLLRHERLRMRHGFANVGDTGARGRKCVVQPASIHADEDAGHEGYDVPQPEASNDAPESVAEKVRAALQRLGPADRWLLTAKFIEGGSYQAVADRAGRPVSTVHRMVGLAVAEFAAALGGSHEAAMV